MSGDRFILKGPMSVLATATRTEDPGVNLYVEGGFDSSNVWLTPEEAVRFGFHLAGLGAKALREKR